MHQLDQRAQKTLTLRRLLSLLIVLSGVLWGVAQGETRDEAPWKKLYVQTQWVYKIADYRLAEKTATELIKLGRTLYSPHHVRVALAYGELGRVYKAQGKYGLAANAYKKYFLILRKSKNKNTVYAAAGLNNLGVMAIKRGAYATAERLFARSLSLLSRATDPLHPARGTLFNNFAEVRKLQGRWVEAREIAEKAVWIRERPTGGSPEDLAASYANLGQIYQRLGMVKEAEEFLLKSLKIRRRIFGSNHPETAVSSASLGDLYAATGRFKEALIYQKEALAIRQKNFPANHPALAESQEALGSLLMKKGEFLESDRLLSESLKTRQRILGAEHPETSDSLLRLGQLRTLEGRYNEAGRMLQRSLSIREKNFGKNSEKTSEALEMIGNLLLKTGDIAEADKLYTRAKAIRLARSKNESDPSMASALEGLGLVYLNTHRYQEGLTALKTSLKLRENFYGAQSLEAAESFEALGRYYYVTGNLDDAGKCLEKSYELKRRIYKEDEGAFAAESFLQKGRLAYLQFDYRRAKAELLRAKKLWERYFGFQHPGTISTLANLGLTHLALAEYSDAKPFLEKALSLGQALYGHESPFLVESLGGLARIAWEENDIEKAKALYRDALKIQSKYALTDDPAVIANLRGLMEAEKARGASAADPTGQNASMTVQVSEMEAPSGDSSTESKQDEAVTKKAAFSTGEAKQKTITAGQSKGGGRLVSSSGGFAKKRKPAKAVSSKQLAQEQKGSSTHNQGKSRTDSEGQKKQPALFAWVDEIRKRFGIDQFGNEEVDVIRAKGAAAPQAIPQNKDVVNAPVPSQTQELPLPPPPEEEEQDLQARPPDPKDANRDPYEEMKKYAEDLRHKGDYKGAEEAEMLARKLRLTRSRNLAV